MINNIAKVPVKQGVIEHYVMSPSHIFIRNHKMRKTLNNKSSASQMTIFPNVMSLWHSLQIDCEIHSNYIFRKKNIK